ncbi:MAG: hypothetical protein R3324_01625, partial [Halobacteriales archaeon]|nr:hypothetical protein [Halobacteriales archaeon]
MTDSVFLRPTGGSTVYLRGTVVEAGDPRTVATQYGDRDLVEVRLKVSTRDREPADPDPLPPDGLEDGEAADADPVRTLTLWGDWVDTATSLESGMTLAVTAAQADEWDGARTYATTGDSFVVIEPDDLIDVTAVRSWVQCPRIYYLNTLSGVPLKYPVVLGTVVHEVFGDLLRGRDRTEAVADAVADAGLELGLLDRDAAAVKKEVDAHARAIEG